MRPVLRGNTPNTDGYRDYRDAFDSLLERIGVGHRGGSIHHYCSYCERNIPTNLAVEHIQPKSRNEHLETEWTNFLLACVNCNSTKGNTDIDLSSVFLPDRDNTFEAFDYLYTGRIEPCIDLTEEQKVIAQATIDLFGLNAKINTKSRLVSKDRQSQRLQAYLVAKEALSDLEQNPDNPFILDLTVKLMLSTGFFSIWMKVFDLYPDMKNAFINSISGTRESGCFSEVGASISPHPNRDGLCSGGKV